MIQPAFRHGLVVVIILLLNAGCTPNRIGQKPPAQAIEVRELAKTSRSWDGACLPAYPQTQPEITIRRIRIPAGAKLELHRHPVINAGILISGQLTVETRDGKTLHLRAGDPIVEVVNTLHSGLNSGNIPADIVIMYAGTTGTPINVLESR